MSLGQKPRLLLLVGSSGWAYDTIARALVSCLSDEFELKIAYIADEPDLNAWPCDLVYVMFWGDRYHQRYFPDPARVIKGIHSHRWEIETEYGSLSPVEAAREYLADAGALAAVSKRLKT